VRRPTYPHNVLFEVVHRLGGEATAAVQALVARARVAGDHSAVDDHRLALATSSQAPRLVAALAWDDGHRELVGYVQAVRGRAGWDLEQVVDATAATRARDADGLARRLLKAALDAVTVEDGSDVRLWAYRADRADDQLAATLGLHPARELWQMRRPLPVEGAEQRHLPTRPFKVGRDEEAWLEVNGRAFGWHPDQGGWTLADLRAREQEPWFDPRGFLLYETEGRLAGFCWTKIHADADPPLGEIYVIAVDPDWHGKGLGRALTLAGLDHLAAAGITIGMLYVESTNTAATRLYRSMGFALDHVDRVYRSLAPTG